MRKRYGWLGVCAVLLLTPALVQAQQSSDYEVPLVDFVGPLSHPRPENGGFYVGVDFLYWLTNRVMYSQQIAKRGFLDNDGSVTGKVNHFEGSGDPALSTLQLQGPGSYQTGFDLFVGWKFESGVVVELDWKHLVQAQYNASASILPPNFQVGNLLQNTFLFAPVSNFPEQFAGAALRVPQGNPGALYGIWNGASVMEISLTQRFDTYGINVRVPIWQTDNYRSYGLFGPRIVWIWDEFRWTAIDYDLNGNTSPDTTAIYHNMVSNRMYGAHFGVGNDWFLGTTPIGGISATLDLEAGLYANLVKVNAGYVRADNVIAETRARRLNSLVPSVEGRLGLTWYPWEAIQIHLGYDFMGFFNTIASPKPVDFNMGTLDPQYSNIFLRWFTGMTFGITFIF